MVAVDGEIVKKAWDRYKIEVNRTFLRFEEYIYRTQGFSVKYLPEADRRRVLELGRRIRGVGLGFEEGVGILLAFWTAVTKAKPGHLPVRLWTLLSKRSLEALVEERNRRYPGGEWRCLLREDLLTDFPESFPSIVEWKRYLSRARLRADSRTKRNYRA